MEASALQAPVALSRIPVPGPLLRLRSDEQLVELFRAGSDDAFRVIHDRYRQRLFAYVRQMLAGPRQDAEDALQDVFLRAYGSLRENGRPVSLRAWLYRVAHNRCIDHMRRPVPIASEVFDLSRGPLRDPLAETERREDLRRLVQDVRRLPDQQRSALLMREMQGMSYAELAAALDVTIPAIKSLLVRARMGLVEAAEARDTGCVEIREGLCVAYDRGVRMSGLVRRHMRDCRGCREYRLALRGVQRGFDSLIPSAGPFGLLAKLGLGGGGAAAGGGAATGGGGVAVVGGGGLLAATATGKLASLISAAALVTGGAFIGPHPRSEPRAAAPARVHLAPAEARNTTAAQALASVLSAGAAAAHAAGPGSRGRRDGASPEVIDPGSLLFANGPSAAAPAAADTQGNGGAPAPTADSQSGSPSAATDLTGNGQLTQPGTAGAGSSSLPSGTQGSPGSGSRGDPGGPKTTPGSGTSPSSSSAPGPSGAAAGPGDGSPSATSASSGPVAPAPSDGSSGTSSASPSGTAPSGPSRTRPA